MNLWAEESRASQVSRFLGSLVQISLLQTNRTTHSPYTTHTCRMVAPVLGHQMESRGGRGLLQPVGDSDDEELLPGRLPPVPVSVRQTSRRKESIRHHHHPKPPLTPNTGVPPSMPQTLPNPLLPSAPASPPTPAPSPTPHQRSTAWNNPAEDHEDSVLRDASFAFSRLSIGGKESWLASIVDTFDTHLLNYVHQLVSPRLKKDPFQTLPNELCFRVCRT